MRAVVELAVGHQLVDIGLAHAPFWIVDPRDALPLRVDDEGDLAAPPDDQVGTCPEPSRLSLEEAVAVPALRCNSQFSARESAGKQSPHVFLKEDVHLEQQPEAVDRTSARLLVAVTEKEARQRK